MSITFPNPNRIQFHEELPPKKCACLVDAAAKEAQDTGTLSNINKLGKAFFGLLTDTIHIPSELSHSVSAHFCAVSDTLKICGIFKNIKEIHDQVTKEKNRTLKALSITRATAGLVVGGMSAIELGEHLKFWKLGKSSDALKSALRLRKAFSFGNVLSFVEIIEGAFSIAIASIKIHSLNQGVKKAKEKLKKWEEGRDVADKIQFLRLKRKMILKEAQNIALEVERTKAEYEATGLKRTLKEHKALCKTLDTLKAKFKEIINRNKIKNTKIIKWKNKIKAIHLAKAKEGFALGMSIFLVLFLITKIVLSIIFPVFSLAVTISLAVIGLLLSMGMAARHFFPKILEYSKC